MPAKPRGERPGAWWISEHGHRMQLVSPGATVDYGPGHRAEVALWRLAQLHRIRIDELAAENHRLRGAVYVTTREAARWRRRAGCHPGTPVPGQGCDTCRHYEDRGACVECATGDRWEEMPK
jgi:hypothetical protein